MMTAFADMVNGKKENPYTYEYELALYRVLLAACGVEPVIVPIRGGTDGARLSYMGLPCPNLSTGGYNFHGRKEMIPVPAMEKMVEVLEWLVVSD